MLKRVAQGVLVHKIEFIQSNSVVLQGRDGVLVIDPGISVDEMASLANDLRRWVSPSWQASRRILIGTTCFGTRTSARCSTTAVRPTTHG